jgi:hypothetical protein
MLLPVPRVERGESLKKEEKDLDSRMDSQCNSTDSRTAPTNEADR